MGEDTLTEAASKKRRGGHVAVLPVPVRAGIVVRHVRAGVTDVAVEAIYAIIELESSDSEHWTRDTGKAKRSRYAD